MKIVKYTLITVLIIGAVIAVAVVGLWWSWGEKIEKDQVAAANDPIGKEFMELYPDSYNYEFTNDTSIHLNAIPNGTTNLFLIIPRDGDKNKYSLHCQQPNGKAEYFTLSGLTDEMINAVKNASCFDKAARSNVGKK